MPNRSTKPRKKASHRRTRARDLDQEDFGYNSDLASFSSEQESSRKKVPLEDLLLDEDAEEAVELMSKEEFISISGGIFSGERNNVLDVDKALENVSTNFSSRSQALDQVIFQCNKYLNSDHKKARTRVTGVTALLRNAEKALEAWYNRPMPPRPDFVYRLDKREPSVIAERGFLSTGQDNSDVTIIEHVNCSLDRPRGEIQGRNPNRKPQDSAKSHTHWVSTGGTIDVVRDRTLLAGLKDKRLYKIDTREAPENFHDAGLAFNEAKRPNPYESQLEWAHSGNIPPAWVTEYAEGEDIYNLLKFDIDAKLDELEWHEMPS